MRGNINGEFELDSGTNAAAAQCRATLSAAQENPMLSNPPPRGFRRVHVQSCDKPERALSAEAAKFRPLRFPSKENKINDEFQVPSRFSVQHSLHCSFFFVTHASFMFISKSLRWSGCLLHRI